MDRSTVGAMAAVVAAEGVVKTYGQGRAARRVLDGASLHVQPGEVVAILGRSGTGKSTLLHLIGGLDRPEAGTISVAGERVTDAGERALSRLRRQRIGFVFQFFHLLPELSGEANVLLAGRVRGAGPDAVARGQDLIDRLGLRPVARSLPHQLSGGEQQRFAVARALVNDPAVLLADEPTGNLDVQAGAEVLRLLRAGAAEGRAVVMVTHETAAAGIADRVLTLRDGLLGAA
jgi:ABC-type lipoprotein export system ATPase subunit